MSKSMSATCALLLAAMLVDLSQAPPAGKPGQGASEWGVPIGTILPWWGLEEDIPYGFEACDGRVPTTAGAVFRDRKPDLRERFLRGAEEFRTFLPNAFKGGGSSAVQLSIAPHALTLSEIPGHAHGLANHTHANVHSHGIAPHSHEIDEHVHPIGGTVDASPSGSGVPLVRDGAQTALTGPASLSVAPTALTTDPSNSPTGGPSVPDTAFAGGTKPGSQSPAAAHTHTLNSNSSGLLPPFLDVIYVIRVK